MGVPAFFRWLSRKYPSVIIECIENKPVTVDGVQVPVNTLEPNPNGVEFDNLYLDMNGIIHPCTHPEDKPAPKNEDEMMEAIFECIDRLFRIVRPRKLLYMAIDGVAPRAKMNQQRSRRFRASKETSEKLTEIARIRSELALKGAFLPPEKPKEDHFDSNCITPGTPFMARLSACLHYYIHDRLNNDPGWKNIKVILSDANVPGEGEHKIMDYIRKQRAQPDHDPNTQHVLCGADADLIMLGLATHEPNFTIIREEFKPNKPRPCDICGQLGHDMQDCLGAEPNQKEEEKIFGSECQFIFVRLNVLREYLERELQMPNLPFKYEFERAIDDWVFMCFFVGNDFLPHLPSLEIRENAIDRLVNLYKKTVYKTGGFLTNSGDVNLDRVQLILSDLGNVEDEIFKKRQQNELAFKAREKNKKRRMEAISNYKPSWTPMGQFAPNPLGKEVKPVQNARYEAFQMRMQGRNYNTYSVERALQGTNATLALDRMIVPASGTSSNRSDNKGQKRKHDEVEEEEKDDQAHDEVRLWEDGFKDRYYESKFDVLPENLAFRNNVALQYVRGLCWVLRYYYQGCASWKWYFPYHYAPFASDFVNIGGLSTEFEKGTVPFRPLEQLMGVFPAASCKHVPEPWAKLMKDPRSTIIDFYPEDFKIDLNGKKFAWQGVALLPFVEEDRLFKALEPYYDLLTPAEKRRNVRGDDRLYVGPDNKGYQFLQGLYENKIGYDNEVEICIDGMRGTVLLAHDCVGIGATLPSPINTLPVRNNQVICVRFRDPKYSDDYMFPAKRLQGAEEPPRVLKPQDFEQMNRGNNDWKPQTGFVPSNKVAMLGDAGHRMLGRNINNSNRQPGVYGHVPPPASLQHSSRGYQSGYSSDRQKDSRNHPGYQTGNLRQNSYQTVGPWAGGYTTNSYQPQQSYQSYQQRGYHQQMQQSGQQRIVRPFQNQHQQDRNFNQSQRNRGNNRPGGSGGNRRR
ncbi:5'-3' exoribonuclease 2 homolog [Phymastichus coffea]|uniref:5'-3' exoribonuclease 2 homolog n=1 Tax=Phymastichus coffea TaxID=108790 RepID=UPI00273C28B8|nr:5'-3' exoribonuclease 2 homolog [Phymastichus coffea]XP_058807468.1 5'-3' exoribonuclease 2 homolog [Phymastichus coffea]XP_058807469.1 5'-3' exoribonuclease 2 homolog [Phymastichus coffea]XP_058807470.1 5'-3' exoribonuclease 2 homolog [Phymastichus coffea]